MGMCHRYPGLCQQKKIISENIEKWKIPSKWILRHKNISLPEKTNDNLSKYEFHLISLNNS